MRASSRIISYAYATPSETETTVPGGCYDCLESSRIRMLQTVLDHLDKIVRPAIRDYVAAEEALNAAHASKDQTAIAAARDNVMRLARTAAIETHHLQDVILSNLRPQYATPERGRKLAQDLRTCLSPHSGSPGPQQKGRLRPGCFAGHDQYRGDEEDVRLLPRPARRVGRALSERP